MLELRPPKSRIEPPREEVKPPADTKSKEAQLETLAVFELTSEKVQTAWEVAEPELPASRAARLRPVSVRSTETLLMKLGTSVAAKLEALVGSGDGAPFTVRNGS